jgi:hypothetical protein
MRWLHTFTRRRKSRADWRLIVRAEHRRRYVRMDQQAASIIDFKVGITESSFLLRPLAVVIPWDEVPIAILFPLRWVVLSTGAIRMAFLGVASEMRDVQVACGCWGGTSSWVGCGFPSWRHVPQPETRINNLRLVLAPPFRGCIAR